jgi:hypothetical protein
MPNFRTSFKIEPISKPCRLKDTFITLGSCFSDTMGQQLTGHKFNALVNPFGTIYNPESIHKVLQYALTNKPPAEHTYVTAGDIVANYDFHSSHSDLKQADLEKKLTETIGITHYFLKEATWLMITYGTAWVYTRNDTGETVANCHKLPGNLFTKELLTQKKILDSFTSLYHNLKSFNPEIRIILTVSPVRHTKDTLPLNSVSKSVLRIACHTLSEQHNDIHYFPAYEILLDDLRDYRFYKSDMIHPTEEAEQYIWDKFIDAYFDSECKSFIEKWDTISLGLKHKPFHPSSKAHQEFLSELLSSLENMKSIVNVDQEMEWVKSQLR